jgi:glycolate oxidase subunit GlcD
MAATLEENTGSKDRLIDDLRAIVGHDNVLSEPEELLVYECDGLPQHKHPPRAVVFPSSTEAVSAVLKVLSREGVSFAPRGAGTGLSGGALAVNRGVVIELARMRKILKIDPENRLAIVQTGLVNAHLSRAVAPYGLYYVPDPSSQPSCTIGGNIAENAGGIHCLKYGTTTDHVLGARVVLSDGAIVDLGGASASGYDLLGTFIGSEGTFGIATEATLRLSPVPPAIRTLLADFTDVYQASSAVSAIIAGGLLPAALEMMDNAIIRAIEESVFAAGLPIDAQAVLLVEIDGVAAGLDEEAEQAEAILRRNGARQVHRATDEHERKKLWAARKGAFGAVGRLSPDMMIQDAVVPRSRLPEVLAETYRISAKYDLKLANVFHAGDGNLHPLICFDLRNDDAERVRQAGREIMETCVRAGGSITGEHGVGLDKSSYLPLIFSDDDMTAMLQVRAAFDPSGLCNPGKIIPTPRGCGEARAVATRNAVGTDADAVRQQIQGQRDRLAPSLATSQKDRVGTAARTQMVMRLKKPRVIAELAYIVGALNLAQEQPDRASVLIPASAVSGDRPLTVAPASAEEACDVLRLATREDLSVIPAGASTWLDAGNPLRRADIILTSKRMAGVFSHEPADLVASAAAGTTLAQFQEHVARARQWLPIDPPDDGRVTLGGVIATGLAGPQSFGYGRPRSFVIGMRVALADGRLIKAGGNVVKNVAGYDLCKLFTGSYGTLGLIVELTFKLRPLPAETRTVIATGSLDSLLRRARAILSGELFPVAVDLLSSALAEDLEATETSKQPALLIRFAGSSQAVVSQAAHALKLLRTEPGLRCDTLAAEDDGVWRNLGAWPLRFDERLIWRVGLLPTDLMLFLTEVQELEHDEASHPSLRWHASIGEGRLRAIARPPVYHREAVRALGRLRERAEKAGGSLVLESAPQEIKAEFDSWGGSGSATELMRRVKSQLDPQALLSPGRFVAL